MIALTLRRRRGGRPPPDRLDRRGDAVRGHRARRGLGALVFFGALALGRLDATLALGPVRVTPLLVGHRARRSGSLVVSGLVPARAGARVRAAGGRRRPDDPIRLLEPPARRPTAGCGLGRSLGLPLVWAAVCLVAVPLGVYVVTLHPVGARSRTTSCRRLAGRPHGPDAARPDRPDVRLPQQPVVGPRRVLAVVGLAVRPQARVVLPGQLGRRDVGRALRRGQPRDLVARRPGPGLRRDHGVPPAQPRPRAHRHRLRRAVGLRGRASTGPPSSTTTTRRCRSWSWPSPTSSPSCGTARRDGPGWPSASRGAAAVLAPAALWLLSRPLCAFVGVQDVNPGSQACPAVIPDFVLTLRAAGCSPSSRSVPTCSSRAPRGPRPATGRAPRRPVTSRSGRSSIGVVGVALGFAVVAVLRRDPDPYAPRHPGRADRPDRGPAAGVPGRAGLRCSRRPSVRRRDRRGRRRLAGRGSTRTSRRCRSRRTWSTPTRACCRPTSTPSSSRSARRSATFPTPFLARPWRSCRWRSGDLPGGRLLGVGLAARARRIAGRGGRLGRWRLVGRWGGHPGSDRRRRLRDLGAGSPRAAHPARPAGGSRSRSSHRPWRSPAAS